MAGPIYKLFLNRFTAAYHDAPQETVNQMLAEFEEVSGRLGIKMVVLCEAGGWASEEWDFWGVSEFPNLEALQKLKEWQDSVHWFKYVESMSVLGSKPAA